MARRGKMVLVAGVVGVIALLLALLGWQVLDRQEGENTANAALAGERPVAPAFTLPELDGAGELSLSSLQGKVVVVNFWASWCPPCKDEAPAFEQAWQRWRERGVVIVGVNAQDLTEDARAFVDRYGITYPNVRDAENTIPGKFGVTGFPETAFIDARGRIAVFRPGPVDTEMIEDGIRRALAS